MERYIDRTSKMVSDNINFQWKVDDFSVDNLKEGPIISPLFQCSSRDFQLEVSRSSDQIRVCLVSIAVKDDPRILECHIGIYLSPPSNKWYCSDFTTPGKLVEISRSVSSDVLQKECLVDHTLRIGCKLTTTELKHNPEPQKRMKTAGNEKTFLKTGRKTLSENIGTNLKDSYFSDATLKVGEVTFRVHKAILASRSAMFETMFKSGMKESLESVVEIAEMEPTIVEKMLQYIYTGTIANLSMDAAVDLYKGSDRYDMQELRGWCREFILEHISPNDVCRIALLADLHSDKELIKASRRVFKENAKAVMAMEDWKDLEQKNSPLLISLLSSAVIKDC